MLRGAILALCTLLFTGTPGYTTESRSIIRTPSTAVLPAWGIGLDVADRTFIHGDASGPVIDELAKPASKPVVGLSLGLFGRAEVGASMVVGDRDNDAVSGQFKALLLEEMGLIPDFAIGMLGISNHDYPFPDSFAPAERTADTLGHKEKNSWFGEVGKTVPLLGKLYLGIGGGRFAGHGAKTRNLHGLFGGWRYAVISPVWLAGEVDGRSVNLGAGVSMDVMDTLSLTASVRSEFVENIRKASRDAGLRPSIGAALELVYAPFAGKKDSAPVAKPAPVALVIAPAPAVSATAMAQPVKAKLAPARAMSATVLTPATAVKPVVRRKVVPAPVAVPAANAVPAPAPTAPKAGTGK